MDTQLKFDSTNPHLSVEEVHSKSVVTGEEVLGLVMENLHSQWTSEEDYSEEGGRPLTLYNLYNLYNLFSHRINTLVEHINYGDRKGVARKHRADVTRSSKQPGCTVIEYSTAISNQLEYK